MEGVTNLEWKKLEPEPEPGVVRLAVPFDNTGKVSSRYAVDIDDWIAEETVAGRSTDTPLITLYKRQRTRNVPEYKSQAWFDERVRRVNGSEISAMLGKNKYERIDRFWKKKTGQIPRDTGVSQYMVGWGNDHEQEAMDVYAWLTNTRFIKNNTGSVVHPTACHDHLAATPDFLTVDGVLVEIKCPRTRKIEHRVPDNYYPQLQLQMAVCGIAVSHFVQYKPPSMEGPGLMDILIVKYDPLWFEHISEPTKLFSQSIEEFYKGLGIPVGGDTSDVNYMTMHRIDHPLLKKVRDQAVWCKDFVPDFEISEDFNVPLGAGAVYEHPDESGPESVYFSIDVRSDVPVFTNKQYMP